METQLTSALVAELAGWDPELCDSLAPLRWEQLIHPLEQLAEFARKRKWSHHSTGPNCDRWSCGYCQTIAGKSVAHTSILAISSPEDINLRIWRAEIGVLMPYIEEQRQELLKEISKVVVGAVQNEEQRVGAIENNSQEQYVLRGVFTPVD